MEVGIIKKEELGKKKSMEEQRPGSSAAAINGLNRRRKCRNICLGAMGVLIFIVILVLILAFTVFKPKRPVTTIDNVSFANLTFSLDLLRFQVLLNASIDVDLSIKNPNKVGFHYTDSAAELNYRGQKVGEVPIPAGNIPADETIPMNFTVTIMTDRLVSDSQFFADVLGGELPLNTFADISGEVNVMNLFKIHVNSSTSCDFTGFLYKLKVGNHNCTYKTNL